MLDDTGRRVYHGYNWRVSTAPAALQCAGLVKRYGDVTAVDGLDLHGSVWALGVLALCGAMAFGGIGLLVASRARTIEAVSGLMNVVMLPMWVLSGISSRRPIFPT